jgi:hypothetical protein
MSEKIQKKIYQFDNRITPPKFIDSSNTALEAARYFLAENGNREISTELGFFAYEKPLNLTPNQIEILGKCLTRYDIRKSQLDTFITQGPLGQDRQTFYYHGSNQYLDLIWKESEKLPILREMLSEEDSLESIPSLISQKQMLAVARLFLKLNGNREVKEDFIQWNRSIERHILVYNKPIEFTESQLQSIRWFYIPQKTTKKSPQHIQLLDSKLRPVILTWLQDPDYIQCMQWLENDKAWEKKKLADEAWRKKKIESAKESGTIPPQPELIRIQSSSFEKFKNLEKLDMLVAVLKSSGVDIIHDQNQPTGERFIIVDRKVEIPNKWIEFLNSNHCSNTSSDYCSIDGLCFDWNRISVADEETYYFYKQKR